MKLSFALFGIFLSHHAVAEEKSDLIRFLNGDLMHGQFMGIEEGIAWKAEQAPEPIHFSSKSVSQVIFNGGRASKPSALSPCAHLINGDELPGQLISMDAKTLTFDSSITGELQIPREHLARLQPNPHGGTLHYAGPFSSDGWLMPVAPKEEPEEGELPSKNEKPKDEAPWIYSSAAFYNKGSTPLIHQVDLPDEGRLRFKLAWRNRLNFSIAFQCDLKRPVQKDEKEAEEAVENAEEVKEAAEEPEEKEPIIFEEITDLVTGNELQQVTWLLPNDGNHAMTYGTGYVLSLYSSYPNLNRCFFTETGQPQVKNLRSSRSRSTLGESGEAEFDLRFNKAKKSVVLFIDGEYVAQWNDLEFSPNNGKAIGFAANSKCELRLSDLRITSWNGLKDSALSMKHENRDIVLLSNGTDRFSGEITGISNGLLHLKSAYADIELPLDEISDIHFASGLLSNATGIDWPAGSARIHFQPIGRLSFIPQSAKAGLLKGTSPLLGEDLSIQLDAATLLELHKTPYDLDEWFDEF